MFYSLVKPLLFRLDPETAHHLALKLAALGPILGDLSGHTPSEKLKITVGRLSWRSPVGLAAGLDKNAEAIPFFHRQGFGAIEVGTITLRPQVGNPRPRMFRYPERASLRNSMGFPNEGVLAINERLRFHPGTVGANIGKNKDSTPSEALDELNLMVEMLQENVDYFVVNVSSPNTPGLRALQETSYLKELFSVIPRNKDLFLKIAPDLGPEKIRELVQLSVEEKLTGIIATNTTIAPEFGSGGMSGAFLKDKARRVRELILEEEAPIELIGVGGIDCPADVFRIWAAGGKAFQVYTSYVYQGPELLKNFHRSMEEFLRRTDLPNLETYFSLPRPERRRLASVMLVP